MGQVVASGASLSCTFGSAPAVLTSASTGTVMVSGQMPATIMDFGPMCIPPFGMCMNPANPAVAAATAAALGVLTPQPCMMVPAGPWVPTKPYVVMGGKPVLTTDCKLFCGYPGGCVSVVNPGQMKVSV